MGWTEPNVIIADISDLLSPEAAGKLVAKVVLPQCEGCGHLLTHRGEAHGYIILECVRCNLPYIQAGVCRLAAERSDVPPPGAAAKTVTGAANPPNSQAKKPPGKARKKKALQRSKARV